MKLQIGKSYLSKAGHVWVCYRVGLQNDKHCQAHCIRQSDSRIEYFYLDGRYDMEGKREHCLIEEVE